MMNVLKEAEEKIVEGVEKVAEGIASVADDVAERCAAKAAELKQEDDADAKAVAERCAAKAAAQAGTPVEETKTAADGETVKDLQTVTQSDVGSLDEVLGDSEKAAAEELAAADDAAEDPAQTEGDVVG